MEYWIDILEHVNVGTDLPPCQFMSPQGEAKGYYLFLLFGKYIKF